jgi:cystathionine beta-synthase/cysteine synthase A
MIIVMPEKMSMEKEVTLRALGAEIIRTPTEAGHDDPEGLFEVSKRLNKEIPNSHILDQYGNPDNPNAHYEGTAEEIWDEFGSDLDMVVVGVGTGGTITGIAKKLKEMNPNIKIVGADPYGSILGGGDEIFPYQVEGIGYDFFPDVLDNSLVDQYIKVDDQNSFVIARKLIKDEGLLCGGSSGTVVWAALQAAQTLSEGQKCLCILADGIRNYLSKFIDDNWMKEKGFSI